MGKSGGGGIGFGNIDVSNIGLSPEQAALANFTLGQNNTRTADIYSRLGLGGSTMETQDLGGNQLAGLAQEAGLITQNQQTALQQGQLNLNADIASANQQNVQNQQLAGLAGSIGKAIGSIV